MTTTTIGAKRILRTGARTYTELEVFATGRRHGEDGIMYYPPNRWGKDDDEPDVAAPAWAVDAYRRGYREGRRNGYWA